MAEDSCATRDQPFRDLLLSVSKQLSESDNVEGLRYLADLGHSPCCSALELLKAMRNKGMFSPHFCSPLAELLRKIERHDLADEVMNKYVAVFPDQGKSEIFHLFYNRIYTTLCIVCSRPPAIHLPIHLPTHFLAMRGFCCLIVVLRIRCV